MRIPIPWRMEFILKQGPGLFIEEHGGIKEIYSLVVRRLQTLHVDPINKDKTRWYGKILAIRDIHNKIDEKTNSIVEHHHNCNHVFRTNIIIIISCILIWYSTVEHHPNCNHVFRTNSIIIIPWILTSFALSLPVFQYFCIMIISCILIFLQLTIHSQYTCIPNLCQMCK